MTLDLVKAVLAVLEAVTTSFTNNQGGVVLAFLLILGLLLRVRGCEARHRKSDILNRQLITSLVEVTAVLKTLTGHEVESVASLEEFLKGNAPLVGYKVRKGPGRRRTDKGRTNGEAAAAGGAGDVSA